MRGGPDDLKGGVLMKASELKQPVLQRPGRALLLLAVPCLVLTGWIARNSSKETPAARSSSPAVGPRSEATAPDEELEQLKRSVSALQQKAVSLEGAVLDARRAALAASAQSAPQPQGPPDPKVDEEMHRERLADLDVALATDTGDARDRQVAARTFQGQLETATEGRARVVDVSCGTEFCKAKLEEDTKVAGELDTNVLVDKAPWVKAEAFFDYEWEGTLKRTIVYAVREGRRFPGSTAPTEGQ